MHPTTNTLIVDDHAVFADALASALTQHPEFGQIHCAASLHEATALTTATRPELAIVDLRLGGHDGLTVLTQLAQISPATRSLLLTAHLHRDVVVRARSLGAWAALPKGGSLTELVDALHRIQRGERPTPTEPAAPPSLLSAREREILQLLALGHAPTTIAKTLELSTHTVRDHIKSARGKLGTQTQLAAVLAAARLGDLTLPGT